jgi:hypothetical protein
MRDKNNTQTQEEAQENERVKRRRVKRHPKMKMSGKGMKRFVSPTNKQANPKKPPMNG